MSRCAKPERNGDVSRTIPFFSNPLSCFIGKNVIVKADNNNVVVFGRLIHYEIGNKQNHKPTILILQNSVKMILRTWDIIKEH